MPLHPLHCHFDPGVHAALLKAYEWDTVMMPLNAADHAYVSFEETALLVALERGVAVRAIKISGKACSLRSRTNACVTRVARPACMLLLVAPALRGKWKTTSATFSSPRE